MGSSSGRAGKLAFCDKTRNCAENAYLAKPSACADQEDSDCEGARAARINWETCRFAAWSGSRTEIGRMIEETFSSLPRRIGIHAAD